MSMTPERWEQVQALFEATLARPAVERDAYLREACGGDEALFREVATLLEADGQSGSFLEGHVLEGIDVSAWADDRLPEGSRVGPYRLLRLVGEGGMGLVYLAERADGVFDQQVALKLIKRGMDTALIVRRFEAERRILARLQHPHIARLLDGGVTDDGRPYFVMEYVDGQPIDRYCDAHHLSIDARLDLFVTVCKAVLYAHANLVVHRDLKPENILVTSEGTVKLLDFGIARLLEEREDRTRLTQAGMRVLTPAYASPEQLRGEVVGTSSDIYSLGVVLYELLAGQRPHGDAAPATVTTEPERPSGALERALREPDTAKTISRARGTEPGKLRRKLSGDLDVICLKALRPEPERRYGSVEMFSEDIRRHRTGLPVRARPDTLGYRARKFVRRHRAGVATTAAVALLVSTLVGFYTVRLSHERDRARIEAEKAQQVAAFLQEVFSVSNPSENLGETLTARALLDRGAERLETELEDQPEVLAEMLGVIGDVYSGLGMYEASLAMWEKARDRRVQRYGEEHASVATGLHKMGEAMRLLGNDQAADSLYRLSLAILRRLPEPDREEEAVLLTDMGLSAYSRGDYVAAESLHTASLAVQRTLPEANREDLAAGLNNLALVFTSLGKYEEADSLYQEVLDVLSQMYGEVHPHIATTLRNRAILLSRSGKLAEAEALYRESLAMRRMLYEPDHPLIASVLASLARVLTTRKAYDEAEALFTEALSIQRKSLGDEHPGTVAVIDGLSLLYAETGNYEAADSLRRRALALNRKHFGSRHPRVAADLASLSTLLAGQGAYAEALKARREALEIARTVYGGDHPNIARDLHFTGEFLTHLGRYDEAEPVLRDALAMRIRLGGEEQAGVARSRSRLAEVLLRTGQYAEAESLLHAARSRFASAGETAEVQRADEDLRALYRAWGKPEATTALPGSS